MFELPVDGDRGNMKWVLVRGDGKYSVGTFNGTEFHEETGRFPCNIGPNFYATQTWGNTETGDGRRIQAAWLQGNFSDMPFNQQVTFPCELTLRSTPNGVRLFREPVRELATLHKTQDTWSDQTVKSGRNIAVGTVGRNVSHPGRGDDSTGGQADLQPAGRIRRPDGDHGGICHHTQGRRRTSEACRVPRGSRVRGDVCQSRRNFGLKVFRTDSRRLVREGRRWSRRHSFAGCLFTRFDLAREQYASDRGGIVELGGCNAAPRVDHTDAAGDALSPPSLEANFIARPHRGR